MKETTEKLKSMADIADHLGVTKVSVSLALRNSPLVSQELRERVQQVARSVGFTPRRYRRRQSEKLKTPTEEGRIAVLFEPDRSNDPVAQEILNHAMRRLNELQVPFELVSCRSLYDSPRALDGFSGVIFHFSLRPAFLDTFRNLPQVAIMHEEIDFGPWDGFKPNERFAGKLAAEYLLKQGFRKTLIVWEKEWTYQPEFHPRLEGFRTQVRMAGGEVFEIGYDHREKLQSFYSDLLELLKANDGKLGIFAFCDQIAFRVCTMLDVHGLERKKGRLEVISCDNTPLIRSLQPPLPVVDLHIPEIAASAVDGLLWRVNHPDALARDTHFRPSLIVPESGISS